MRESVYVRRLNGAMLWLMVALLISMFAALGPLLIDTSVPALIFIIATLALTVALARMKATIRVSDERVALSVMGLSVEVPLRSIRSVSVGPETGLKEGAGVRAVDNSDAYVVSGPTVKIETNTASYLASAERPGEVVEDIQSRFAASR
ncbi:hypothetical protein A0K93_03855 [Corynebacterium sp. BCW_4722]|nr:hypothetical protein A0K93_03855 [Corynebacterium sp. BCW_4722]